MLPPSFFTCRAHLTNRTTAASTMVPRIDWAIPDIHCTMDMVPLLLDSISCLLYISGLRLLTRSPPEDKWR